MNTFSREPGPVAARVDCTASHAFAQFRVYSKLGTHAIKILDVASTDYSQSSLHTQYTFFFLGKDVAASFQTKPGAKACDTVINPGNRVPICALERQHMEVFWLMLRTCVGEQCLTSKSLYNANAKCCE